MSCLARERTEAPADPDAPARTRPEAEAPSALDPSLLTGDWVKKSGPSPFRTIAYGYGNDTVSVDGTHAWHADITVEGASIRVVAPQLSKSDSGTVTKLTQTMLVIEGMGMYARLGHD